MRIQQSFEVAAPVEAVWAAFLDIPSVVPCLPGAQLTEALGDDRYAGRVTVKLGPMSFSFDGEATVRVDPASRTGTIEGKGADRKGGSRGSVAVSYSVTDAATADAGPPAEGASGEPAAVLAVDPDAAATESPDTTTTDVRAPRTRVTMETDLTLAGPAAQFGRTGLIEEVSKRLLGEFARCLGARLAAASPAEAAAITAADVGAASLLMGAMTDRLRKGLRGG
ncbi:MAG: SRPBCC family protein [Chloroflexi bacterium]|nr:SRPBCC family protein [Chloroflexota bacterium]